MCTFTLNIAYYTPLFVLCTVCIGLNDWSRKFGYLDSKPAYAIPKGATLQELHLRIVIHKDIPMLYLCGAMHHILLHLDPDYPFQTPTVTDSALMDTKYSDLADSNTTATEHDRQLNPVHTYPFEEYKATSKRQPWHDKKYMGSDCKAVQNLPPGSHVLSLSTNASHPEHESSLTHVIMWTV